MRKYILTSFCALSVVGIANAAGTRLWYEANGQCDGFYLTPPATGCGTSSDKVTSIPIESLTAKATGLDATFDGFYVTDTQIIDESGNLKVNSTQLRTALQNSGQVNLHQVEPTYTCNTGLKQNKNGTCYDDSNENIITIDFENGDPDDGYEIAGTEVGGRGNCQYYRDFDVTVHWTPKYIEDIMKDQGINTLPYYFTYNGASITVNHTPIDWGTLYNLRNQTSKFHYHWDGRLSPGVWTQGFGGSGATVSKITPPSHDGWHLRGLYNIRYRDVPASHTGLDWKDFLQTLQLYSVNGVVESTNTWGRALLGYLAPAVDSSITDEIPVGDDGAWGTSNSRWQIWSCTPITHIDLYADWARACANDMCHITIKYNGTGSSNKGDVIYDTGNNKCPDGSTPINRNTYNPTCTGNGSISIQYRKFQDTSGNSVTCSGNPANTSCVIGETFTFATPNLSCGNANSDYRFKAWNANGNMYSAGETTTCSPANIGANPANISGILCDCKSGSNANGCTSICAGAGGGGASTQSCPTVSIAHGTVNRTVGDGFCEYILSCNSGYIAVKSDGSTASSSELIHTCYGTNCSTSANTWANGLSCDEKITCPSQLQTGYGATTNVTYGIPKQNGQTCTWWLYCKNSNYTLRYNNTPVSGSTAGVSCTGYDNCYGAFMAGSPTYSRVLQEIQRYTCTAGSGGN